MPEKVNYKNNQNSTDPPAENAEEFVFLLQKQPAYLLFGIILLLVVAWKLLYNQIKDGIASEALPGLPSKFYVIGGGKPMK